MFTGPNVPCNDPPGSSETNPIVLEDTPTEAFTWFLWVFYNPWVFIQLRDWLLDDADASLKEILYIFHFGGELDEDIGTSPEVGF